MKNIHLLPTEKPSRLYRSEFTCELEITSKPLVSISDNSINQHIYITSHEEIKDGDWVCDIELNRVEKCQYSGTFRNWKKIILTTDQDLDGVQAIDDEFLEWFVQNPSCEEVEVKKGFEDGTAYGYNFLDYKIHIPQEEQTLKIGDDTNFGVITDIKDNSVCFGKNSKGIDIWYKKSSVTLKPKQETVEEAAERYVENYKWEEEQDPWFDFMEGAKWQAERMYSEEDIARAFNEGMAYETMGKYIRGEDWVKTHKKEWFQQVKKK